MSLPRLIIVATILFINVSPWHAQRLAAQTNRESPLAWRVEVDQMTELFKALRDMTRKSQAPVLVDGLSFKITRIGQSAISTATKQELTVRWQRIMVGELVSEDFENLSDELLQEKTGLTIEKMREMIIKAQPFGMREMTKAQMGKDFFFLVNEEPEPCGGGNGAMVATVAALNALENVQSDYGNVVVMLVGVGDCDVHNLEARRYIKRIKEQLHQALLAKLGQSR